MIGHENEIRRAVIIRNLMEPVVRRTAIVLKVAFPSNADQIDFLASIFMSNIDANWWINNGKDILNPYSSDQIDNSSSILSNCLVCATVMIADRTALACLLDEPVDEIRAARSDPKDWSIVIEKTKIEIWLLNRDLGLF